MSDRDEIGRFLPGTSGNPNGRPPKDESLTEVLDVLGKETEELSGQTRREVLAAKLWEMAIAEDYLKRLHMRYRPDSHSL